ncbi:MAG: cellulase family glycosylhydrolase [Phycisphaerales bacterium]|nr:cellulase family glycosylhydrolase [Phycisphaerales bacterium]
MNSANSRFLRLRNTRTSVRNLARAAGSTCGGGGGEHAFEQLESRALFAADPITANHPVWTAISAGGRIDGQIKTAEWALSPVVERAQAHVDGSSVSMRAKYNNVGLILAFDVRDTRLWSDGRGSGSGDRWEYWHDDSIALFFDPRNTRAKNLPATGRVLAFNLGDPASPTSGPGRIARWDYLKGNGKGGGALVTPDAALWPGIKWKTRINGTVNNNSDVDVGWTTEVRIPWGALGMSGRPANGAVIGMNFDMSFDNDGGERTIEYLGQSPQPQERLGDRVVDDRIVGVFPSLNQSNGGWKGPINYAYLQFVDRAAAEAPLAINDLSASDTSGYGTRLRFTAPAGAAPGRGHVNAYDIRWSTEPIESDHDWAAATVVENGFVPHLRGQAENLRIGELDPGTTYFIGVRGVDAAGRVGDLAQVTVTTQTVLEDTSEGGRVIVSPNGGSMMTESGDPFLMVGGTAGVSALYVRGLYSGLIWSPGAGDFIDFSERQDEGSPDDYFDALADYGVNTMRVQLERVTLENSAEARSRLPEGMAWLEWREPGDTQSTFNPEMRTYLHRMMEQAHRTGMRFILQTFNNFNYGSNLELTPFSTVNGGPLTSMADFYWSPEVLEMCKARLAVLADWVAESPYAQTMIGFELVNEWDGGSYTRTQNAEMQQRSKFLIQLSNFMRDYAPDLNVMSTNIGLAPDGPVGRTLFYSDAFDVLDPHFYTPSTAEPVNNPDQDKAMRPAMDYGQLAAYWLTNRRDNRPVHNAEWDLVGNRWSGGSPYYTGYSDNADPDKPYTLEQDEAIYRVTSWVSIASGLAGAGLRIGGSELRDTYPEVFDPEEILPVPLSLGMRGVQQSVSSFVSGAESAIDFDWSDYRSRTLVGRMSFANTGEHHLRAWGSTDGQQGMALVLRDAGQSSGTVTGASLNIEGLVAGATYIFEFWSTDDNAAPISLQEGVVAGAKFTTAALPAFGSEVMVKFKRVA